MKELKTSIFVLALFFAAPFLVATSYAATENYKKEVKDSTELCGFYYRKALNEPLIVNQTPVTIDKEKVAEIETLRKIVDEQVMPVNIADLPSYAELYKYDNKEQARQVLIENGGLTEDDAEGALRYLVATYYFGEYVPKDDYQAVLYLEKLLSHYRQVAPEQASNIIMNLFYDLGHINNSENNPTWKKNNPYATFKILIAAGSLETEALLIEDDYSSLDASCTENMLPKLTELAEQGSRIAIHKLADIHTKRKNVFVGKPEGEISSISTELSSDEDVNALFFDEPNNKGKYWRQKAEENPLAKYESGF